LTKLAIDGGKPVSEVKIPLVKPTFSQKDAQDIKKILKSAYVRMGPYTKEFEEKFAEKVGAKYAYAVSNGTAALHCAYLSTLKPGDEVIAPAFTFIATISTIYYSFAKPVLADVEDDTFLLDPERVKEKITKKTRAIAPVHLFGNSCNIKALKEIAEDHKLLIINDCAQAHGTEYGGKDLGSHPNASCYSFYPTKTMTTGEGGIVTTDDAELYRLGNLMRSHGDDGRYHHIAFGLNYRITDIMSAIGLNQLAQLDDFLEKRRKNAAVLRKGLEKIPGVKPQKITPSTNPSYSYFSVVLDLDHLRCDRDQFLKALVAENIDCGIHYPISLTKQPIVQEMLKQCSCPVSEDLSKRIMSLPMHPYLTRDNLSKVIDGVRKVHDHYAD